MTSDRKLKASREGSKCRVGFCVEWVISRGLCSRMGSTHGFLSSLTGRTSCIAKSFSSRSFFISSPLWIPSLKPAEWSWLLGKVSGEPWNARDARVPTSTFLSLARRARNLLSLASLRMPIPQTTHAPSLASFVTRLKAQGPPRTCNESKKRRRSNSAYRRSSWVSLTQRILNLRHNSAYVVLILVVPT